MTPDRRRGRHGRAYQVRAPTEALPALEITVRGRGTMLAGEQLVGIHGEAHGAPGLPPLETRRGEDLVETLGLGLRFDLP